MLALGASSFLAHGGEVGVFSGVAMECAREEEDEGKGIAEE